MATPRQDIKSAVSLQSASSLQTTIAPEIMATPARKRRTQKKNDDEVLLATTSRQNDRLPKTKMKKYLRVKTQQKLLYHL
jgi:hypothetical protein